jgi:hypothetical protein
MWNLLCVLGMWLNGYVEKHWMVKKERSKIDFTTTSADRKTNQEAWISPYQLGHDGVHKYASYTH